MSRTQSQRGVGLIEVLIALVVVSIGLLGLAALQGKAQQAEMESYQRSQALILLQDMSNRLRANRTQRANYVTKMAGCGTDTTRAAQDLCEWSQSLTGASETLGGNKVGAMIAGHGCITGSGNDFEVIVEWQGLTPLAQTITKNKICDQPTPAIPESLRRTISVPVRFFTP